MHKRDKAVTDNGWMEPRSNVIPLTQSQGEADLNQIEIGLVQQLAVAVAATYFTTVRKIQILTLQVNVMAKFEREGRDSQLLFSILQEAEVRINISVNSCMLANISLKG